MVLRVTRQVRLARASTQGLFFWALLLVARTTLAQQSDDPPAPDDFMAQDDETEMGGAIDPDARPDDAATHEDSAARSDDDPYRNEDDDFRGDRADDDARGYDDDDAPEREAGDDVYDDEDAFDDEEGAYADEDPYDKSPVGTDADYQEGYDDGAATVGMMTALPWVGIGCLATGCGGAIPIVATVIPYVGALIGPASSLVVAILATVVAAVVGGIWSDTIPSAVTEESERYEDGYREALGDSAWLYRMFGSLGGSAIAIVGVVGLGTLVVGSGFVLYSLVFGFALLGGGAPFGARGATGAAMPMTFPLAAQAMAPAFVTPQWGEP